MFKNYIKELIGTITVSVKVKAFLAFHRNLLNNLLSPSGESS